MRHALIAAHAFFITLASCLEILFILLQSLSDLSISCRKCTAMGSEYPGLLTRHLPSLLPSPPHLWLWATCGYRAGQSGARCLLTSDMQREPFQSLCARSCPTVFHRGEGQGEEAVPSTGPSIRGVCHLFKEIFHNRFISIFLFIVLPENNLSKSNFCFFLRGRELTRKFYFQMKLGVLCN